MRDTRGIKSVVSTLVGHYFDGWPVWGRRLIGVGLAAALALALEQAGGRWLTHSPLRAPGVSTGFALFGGHAIVQLVFGGLMVVVLGIARGAHRLSRAKISTDLWLTGFAASVAAWPFSQLGAALGSGRWIAAQSYAPYLPGMIAVAGGLVIAAYVWLDRRFKATPSSRIGWGLTSLSAAAAVALAGAEPVVLTGLYVPLHRTLYLASAFALFMFTQRLLAAIRRPRTRIVLAVTTLLTAVALIGSVVMILTPTRARRAQLLRQSQTMAPLFVGVAPKAQRAHHLRMVLERVRDHKPILDAPPLPRAASFLDTKDWNVLLVVVDAMRADAVAPWRNPGQDHSKTGDTPNIDRWIETAFRFKYAYAQADITEKSMPSLFYSSPSSRWETPEGRPFPNHLAALGKTPLAVVNALFKAPKRHDLSRLLAGFDHVETYPHRAQQQQLPKLSKLISQTAGKPFFAWLHLYCLHNPYFDGKRLLRSRMGAFPDHYRQGVKWLDGEFQRLLDRLDALGVTDNTIVILTADHGEGLGVHGLNTHGSYVFEEEVRVPLAIHIPGVPGKAIPAAVGNIDILPTVLNLLSAPAVLEHTGHSLVPLMLNPAEPWQHTYYLENAKQSRMGVVQGRDKLIYRPDADLLSRFELRLDPLEKINRFDPKGELDRYLLSRMVVTIPELFAHELKRARTRKLLESLLERFPRDGDADILVFLIRAAVNRPHPELRAAIKTAYDHVTDPGVKRRMADILLNGDRAYWQQQLGGTREKPAAGLSTAAPRR